MTNLSIKLPRKKALFRKFPALTLQNKTFIWVFLVTVLLLSIAFLTRAVLSSNFITVKLDNIHCVAKSDLEILVNSEKINLVLNDQLLKNKLKKKYSCIEGIHKRWGILSLEIYVSGRKPILGVRSTTKTVSMPELTVTDATASTQAARPSPSVLIEYGETFWVDETGLLFAKKEYQSQVPELDYVKSDLAIGQIISKEYVQRILGIIELLNKQSIGFETIMLEEDTLTITGKDEVSTDQNSKNKVDPKKAQFIFSLSGDYTTEVTSLQLILQKAKMNSKSIQKIDLRFKKPVVIYTSDKKK